MEYLSRWLVRVGGTLRFAREYGVFLVDSRVVCDVIWFFDETHFHLDGYIYKQTFSWACCYCLPCCTYNSFRTSRWATFTSLRKLYKKSEWTHLRWRFKLYASHLLERGAANTSHNPQFMHAQRKRTAFPYFLKTLCSSRKSRFLLYLFLLEHASAVFCFLCHIL